MTKENTNLKKTKSGLRAIDMSALERMQKPGYHYISRGLSWDATSLDKTKYEIQQNILRYKRENGLSEKEIKQKLGIKQDKLDCLLFAHLEHFTLDELVKYASELIPPFELKIVPLYLEKREHVKK